MHTTILEKFKHSRLLYLTAALIVLTPISVFASTILVPTDQPTIEAAISASTNGDIIEVEPGTYSPASLSGINFSGKSISIQSTEGPSKTIIDCQNNSRAFIFPSNNPSAGLQGFTFINGQISNDGGSVYISNGSSPTISECIFQGNNADYLAGAIYISTYCDPVISDCLFIKNQSKNSDAGAVYIGPGSSPTIQNCIFQGNTCDRDGGGVYCTQNATPSISHCRFSLNTAGRNGGAVTAMYDCNVGFTNCVFNSNRAVEEGGAVYIESLCIVDVVECTFSRNISDVNGGAFYIKTEVEVTAVNSIFWGDLPEELYKEPNGSGSPDSIFLVSYSDVQGGQPGIGNINSLPLFRNPTSGDFHLESTSPCVNSANPSASTPDDYDGVSRPQGAGPDMGAFEFRPLLIFPHMDCSGNWETEICLINKNSASTASGTLRFFDSDGSEITSMTVGLPIYGRKSISCSDLASASKDQIKYAIYYPDLTDVVGYTKFSSPGQYRASVPAVTRTCSGSVYLSHIAESPWWTGLAMVNTRPRHSFPYIAFDNGDIRQLDVRGGEHTSFTIDSLFSGTLPEDVTAGILHGAEGFVALELFGQDNQLGGIQASDRTAAKLYYPHLACDSTWWTGLVFYNPGTQPAVLDFARYLANGTVVESGGFTIAADSKKVLLEDFQVEGDPGWMSVQSSQPITGFELFGTNTQNQLAGFATLDLEGTSRVLPKIEKSGWTGIAIVNTSPAAASITLTCCDDQGSVVANTALTLNSNCKKVDLVENFFSGQDISTGTYVKYESDQSIVGFQLNGSSDNLLLDGLPAL